MIYKYIAYRIEDGRILGSASGYWADQAAVDASAMQTFGQFKPAAGIPAIAGAAEPSPYDFKVENGEFVPLAPSGIVLEIDGVVIDLEALGIDPAHPYPDFSGNWPHIPLRLGQKVKIKNIKAGTTYVRKNVAYVAAQDMTVSWTVAKSGNSFFTEMVPYQKWDVVFDFVPS